MFSLYHYLILFICLFIYLFFSILGLSVLGPITAKKSYDTLKIAGTIKFNETVN